MKILYVTSEAVPFCKTGGLADVSGSLPPALAAAGGQTAVVLPLYRRVREQFGRELEYLCYDYIDLAWRKSYCGLFRLVRDGVTWYFLDNEQYFDRPDLYGYIDDGERFGFFSRAVVRMLPHLAFWPEVIHCNDWQTALIPIYLKDDGVREDRYRSIRTVMTVHNIEYQGRYGREILGDVFGLDKGWADDGTILMDGDVNLLKGAVLCADAVTAVSPSYAEELKYAYFAHGMESIMRRCGYKLSGVLNGIDMVRYDPARDPNLTAPYGVKDLSGKAKDKAELQRMLGLREEADTPLIGMVSRLVAHKGLDLVTEVLHDIMELPVQLAVLGQGDKKYEQFFTWAQSQYPGRIAVRLDHNESLSMSIYAGADLFLMPSKSEPCGLSQMIAMRYGTVPVVRETGGLKDTVHPYEAWRDAGNGFTFAAYNSGDMLFVLRQAVGLYRDYREQFRRLQLRGMEEDFSWKRSAGEYLRIYSNITGRPWPVPPSGAAEKPEKPAKNGSAPEKPAKNGSAPEKPAGSGKAPEKPAESGKAPEKPAGNGKAPEKPAESGSAPEPPAKATPAEPAAPPRTASRPPQPKLAAGPARKQLAAKPAQKQLTAKPKQAKLASAPQPLQLAEKAAGAAETPPPPAKKPAEKAAPAKRPAAGKSAAKKAAPAEANGKKGPAADRERPADKEKA